MGVCMLMMGPSEMIGLPNELWIIIAGFPILGIFQVFVFIPIIPEMLERLQVTLNISEGEDADVDDMLNDKVNDAYGFIYAFSNFIAPLMGSYLYEYVDHRKTFDYIAIADFSFGILILFVNCGPWVFSENRRFKEQLSALKTKYMT